MTQTYQTMLRLSEGGTLILPAEARAQLGLPAGAEILLTVEGRRATLTGAGNGISHEALADIEKEIERSRQMLALEEDWDGKGSPPYRQDVWDRATNFVRQHAHYLLENHGIQMPTPQINPGPDGSIDVHWRTQRFELLLNFPADAYAPAGFYGDDYHSLKIKGKLKVQDFNQGLIQWLVNLL